MKRTLKAYARSWRMKEPFVIARGSQSMVDAVVVELSEKGVVGRGEAVGVPYRGETPATLMVDIGRVSEAIQEGADRQELLLLMPAGGARNALDAALWDLEAKLGGLRAWQRAGMAQGGAVTTALTIGIRPVAAYEQAAAR
ncbi:MAG: dipeptide epimerase, partial [Nevskia sp.]|nr:dipeptide epimerase [Nevskia sp.]